MSDILPDGAEEITSDILRGLDQDKDDGTVYCNMDKPANNNIDENNNNNDKKPKEESEEDGDGDELQFEIYDSDEDQCDDTNNAAMQQHLDSQKQSNDLVNNDTHITTATSTDDDSSGNKENILSKEEVEEVKKDGDDLVKGVKGVKGVKEAEEEEIEKEEEEEEEEEGNKVRGNNKQDVGSRTMEQWLNRDNLIVHPVWIGNLPRGTTVNQLRHFVESQVGRVLVSIHISIKQQNNERTYAFLNLPTAEKQLLAVTLLDGKIFTEEKLIVRPKRPSKFPQSFFGSSPISEHFKHFRDCVVPAILANPTINLNVTSVRKILEQNHINIDHLPNRVWCVQCTLVPQCHRTYCSFYHCHQEKELGRIISILAAQNCGDSSLTEDNAFNIEHKKMLENANNPNTIRSRHTLLIQGLPRSITSKKIEETFEVFGEIDNVIVNPDHTCYVRMKRSQDARKIVHLFKYNHAGVIVDFAPYGASKMTTLHKHNQVNNNNNKPKNDNPANLPPLKHPNLINYATAPQQIHNNNNNHRGGISHYGQQQQHNNYGHNYNNNNNRYNMNKPGLKPAQSDMLPVTNPRYQQNMNNYGQQQFGQHQQYSQNSQYQNNGMNNYAQYNTMNQTQQHQQQQQHQHQVQQQQHNNPIAQMNVTQGNTPRGQNQRNKPKLTDTQSEPIRNQSSYNQYQQQQRGYVNNGGGYFSNMTPQQYAEYYNKWQQQQQYQQSGYNQQQSQQHQMYSQTNYNNNNNGYGQTQQSQTQQNNSYHNNGQQFNPYANSQNILSPIAQTPTNRQSQQQQNNNIYSPTNNQNSQQTPQQSVNQRSSSSSQQQQRGGGVSYGSARKQLGLRNAYSDVITTQQHQPMVANQLKQSPYDDSSIHQKYYYQQQQQQQPQQPQQPQQQQYANNNGGYNMSTYDQMLIQAHQRKNDQHKNWMQQQQTQTQRTRKVITAQPQIQQSRQTSADGSLPNAPAISAIPEPDLHFQLSSHDFPLSPTSALHHTDNKQ